MCVASRSRFLWEEITAKAIMHFHIFPFSQPLQSSYPFGDIKIQNRLRSKFLVNIILKLHYLFKRATKSYYVLQIYNYTTISLDKKILAQVCNGINYIGHDIWCSEQIVNGCSNNFTSVWLTYTCVENKLIKGCLKVAKKLTTQVFSYWNGRNLKWSVWDVLC